MNTTAATTDPLDVRAADLALSMAQDNTRTTEDRLTYAAAHELLVLERVHDEMDIDEAVYAAERENRIERPAMLLSTMTGETMRDCRRRIVGAVGYARDLIRAADRETSRRERNRAIEASGRKVCSRCNGSGTFINGGICYGCDGSGVRPE